MKPVMPEPIRLSGPKETTSSFEERVLKSLESLERRIDAIERAHLSQQRLGPQPHDPEKTSAAVKKVVDQIMGNRAPDDVPPVDLSARVLASGQPVPEDESHRKINEKTGQQRDYVVLSEEERKKGFVRPVRRSYVHQKCGQTTTMALSIAQTFARAPQFYSGGFCVTCNDHFPNDEFKWPDGSQVGS